MLGVVIFWSSLLKQIKLVNSEIVKLVTFRDSLYSLDWTNGLEFCTHFTEM